MDILRAYLLVFLIGIFSLFSFLPQTAFSEDSISHNQTLSNQTLSNQTLSNQTLSNQTLSNQTLSNQTLSNQTLSNQTLSNQTLSNQTFTKTQNSRYQILDEILSWKLYGFVPDQLIYVNLAKVLGGPSGHSLLFDGNASHIEYDSALVNTTHIITAAWVKPTYSGKNNYVIMNDPSGFTLELKNHTRNYYAELSIYKENRWHIFQFPDVVKEKWTYLFAMYDGNSVTIGMDGKFKEVKLDHDENNLLDEIEYAKYEDIPTDVVNYVGDNDPHIHIGTMHFHVSHYNFFSGQIDNVVIYPNTKVPSEVIFTQSNATQLTIPTNVTTHANATIPIPTNVTTPANATIPIPTNVTTPANATIPIPTNVAAVANQILSNATLNMNFSQNSIQTMNKVGKIKTTEGLNGTALQLEGNGLVTTTANETNTLTGLTVSAWVKPNYEQGSSVFTILSKEKTFLLQINNNILPKKVATFSIFDGIQWHTVQSNSTIPQDWTYLVATFNGKEINMYVNGKNEASVPVSMMGISLSGQLEIKNIENLTSSSDVLIGGTENKKRTETSIANFFSGSIDSVSVFKYSLSDAEIAHLYEQGALLKEQLDISTLPIVPHLAALKSNYLITEEPKFEYQYYTENDLKSVVKNIRPSFEPIQHDTWQKNNEAVSVDVTDPRGQKITVKSTFQELRSGKFSIKLASMRDLSPGVYKMKVTLVRDGKTYVSENQFSWGLVSVNTDKSIYKSGELVNFEIVVLDNNGHSVCNSDILMNIKDPDSKITVLSSGDGITKGPECGLYGAHYVPASEGNYTIDISAKNPSGIAQFATSFLVQNNFAFDIVRTAQSKIDPVNNPNSFNVKIDVTSFVNQNNIVIQESVPSVFDVQTDANVQTVGDSKILTWNKDLISGKTSITYSYSVPLVFPQLYALGPVEIDYGDQKFVEARQWFVAADPAYYTSSGTVTIGSTNVCSTNNDAVIATAPATTATSSPVDNLIIGSIQISGSTASRVNVEVYRGTTLLEESDYSLNVATATNSQDFYTILVKDGAQTASNTYTIKGCLRGTTQSVSAQGKILVLNSMNVNDYADGVATMITSANTNQQILTTTGSLPAGNNIILANVEYYDTSGTTAGDAGLTIKDNLGNTKTYNSYPLKLGTSVSTNSTSVSMIAFDANAPAGRTYSVYVNSTAANIVQSEAEIMVIQSTRTYFNDGGPITGISATAPGSTMASVTTGFASNTPVAVIGSQQFALQSGKTSSIAAGGNILRESAVTKASNQFQEGGFASGGNPGGDWTHSLSWFNPTSPSNPTYDLLADAANNNRINGRGQIVAFAVNTPYSTPLSDSVSLSDSYSVMQSVHRDLSDSVSLSDISSVTKSIRHDLSDSISLSDMYSVTKSVHRDISDSVTVTDQPVKMLSILVRGQEGSVTLSDQPVKIASALSQAREESVTLSDQPVKMSYALVHSKEESTTISDQVLVSKILSRSQEESITVSDQPAMTTSTLVRGQEASVTMSDQPVKTSSTLSRSQEESITVSDQPAMTTSTLVRGQEASVTISDQVLVSKILSRSHEESVTLSDQPINLTSTLVRGQEASLTMSDQPVKTSSTLVRGQEASVTMSDQPVKTSSTLVRGQEESVTVSDNVQVGKSVSESQEGSVTISDQPSITTLTLSKGQEGSVTISDQPVRMLSTLSNTHSESSTLSDNVQTVLTLSKSQSESLTMFDNVQVGKSLSQTHNESTNISDQPVKTTSTLSRTTEELATLSDNVNLKSTLSRTTEESITISDNVNLKSTLSRTGKELATVSDNTLVGKSMSRMVNETIGLSDEFSSSVLRQTSNQENVKMTDGISLLKIGSDQYLVPDNQITVSVNPSKPNLVVTNSSAALSKIIIPSTVTSSTLSYSTIVSSGTVHMLHTLNITKDVNADNKPEIIVTIPAVTDISNPAWDGILQLPTVQSTSLVLPAPPGQSATTKTEIGLGSSLPLTFNNATRILFVGEAKYHTGFFYNPASVTEISQTCSSDDQGTANSLSAGGSCKIDVGSNLVVWTKHFTGFVTWTLSPIPPTPPAPKIPAATGGGYGTGVITSGMIGGGTTGVSSAAGMLPTGVTLYDVTYDICDKQNVQFTVGSPDQTTPSVRFATTSGVVEAKVSSYQPYAGLSDLVKQNVISYDAYLKPGTKTFDMLVVPGNGTGYVTAKVDVTKCKQTVIFTPIPIIGQYSPDVPKTFDVKLQVDNETRVSASETQDKYVTNQTVTISGLIYSPVQLDRAEIRTVKVGENASNYSSINASIVPIQVSNTYLVSATLPKDYLVPPAVNYWIYAKNIEGFESESEQYSIGVSPGYDVSGGIGLVIPQNVPAGLTQSPQVYFKNNAKGVLYGTISLVVDGKQVSQFADHVFDRGTSIMELNWDVPKNNDTMTHSVQAVAILYGKVLQSDKAEVNSYVPTKVIQLDNMEPISSLVDKQGNVVATPKFMYSSFVSDNATKFHVTSPDGQCVIGESSKCLVNESTITTHGRYSNVAINGQQYTVYYSGTASPLQRFTITSLEPIVGDWKITLEKNGAEQKDLEDATSLKIKFAAVNKQLLISLP